MVFKQHPDLVGQHAFLGASKYHWLNYSEEKLIASYISALAVVRGIEDHEFASTCINRRQRLPKSTITLNMFVNDAIGYRMNSEQVLYYSENCFGTADAISYKEKFLRIHDLKTGDSPTSFKQLIIYAALFCLEYDVNPEDIGIELRIYQHNEATAYIPTGEEIRIVMNTIVEADKIISRLKAERRGD